MLEIILLIIIFVFVIGLAYFATKKLASVGKRTTSNKNMQILETMQVSINQYIYLIKIGDKIIVMGVSKEATSYICDIDPESIDIDIYKETEEENDFKKVLNDFISKKKNKDD